MTRDELVAFIAECFAHPQKHVADGVLFCHLPHVGDLAYLGRVYDPVPAKSARAWFVNARHPRNPYSSFVSEAANGLGIANLSLYGIIEQVDRSGGPGVGQPISLEYGNLWERPANLDDADMVIGGMVGWSSKGRYVMDREGAVRLVHFLDGSDVADKWSSLEAMLRDEVTRLAGLHDSEGRELSTCTDLMHPNGRRWETEIEPGSVRH